MSGKWKCFMKKYQNLCIVYGDCRIFVSSVFMAIFPCNSGQYAVPDSTGFAGLFVSLSVEKEAKRRKERTSYRVWRRRRTEKNSAEKVQEKKETPIHQKPKQEIKKAVEMKKKEETIPDLPKKQLNEADMQQKTGILEKEEKDFFIFPGNWRQKGFLRFLLGKTGCVQFGQKKDFAELLQFGIFRQIEES